MDQVKPEIIENRDFVDFEEEDIQKLNRIETEKFEKNPDVPGVMGEIEDELGPGGRWETHWLTLDPTGRRVYARIYYTEDKAVALSADGRVIREIDYPKLKGEPVPQTVV